MVRPFGLSVAAGMTTILEGNRESGGVWWKTLVGFVGIMAGATGGVGALQDSLSDGGETTGNETKLMG
jgi:hypothetical protein